MKTKSYFAVNLNIKSRIKQQLLKELENERVLKTHHEINIIEG